MRRLIFVWMIAVSLAFPNIPLNAETKGDVSVQRNADSRPAKITSIKGNTITISDDQGHTKTLQMDSVRGLTVGAKTGWCEEDCGRLKIGDQTIRVQRVIEDKR